MEAKILIIEDEALIALGLEDDLSGGGFTITGVVGSVEDALDAIETQSIDAVVLDGNLHGKPSEPIAEKLEDKNIPFVVVTGYSSDQVGDWVKDAPRVTKPYATEELILAVKNLLK